MFLVHVKLHESVAILPKSKFFDKHELICTDAVGQAQSGTMFWLLIAHFTNQMRQILKWQVVASPLINPTSLVRSKLTAQETLSIVDERATTDRENSEPLRLPQALHLANPEEEKKKLIGYLEACSLVLQTQSGGTPDNVQTLLNV